MNCEIRKVIYGIKEFGVLDFNKLVKNLTPYGDEPMPHTTRLWSQKTCETTFSLCVNNFGVKYFPKEDANHLINSLQENYKITIN